MLVTWLGRKINEGKMSISNNIFPSIGTFNWYHPGDGCWGGEGGERLPIEYDMLER